MFSFNSPPSLSQEVNVHVRACVCVRACPHTCMQKVVKGNITIPVSQMRQLKLRLAVSHIAMWQLVAATKHRTPDCTMIFPLCLSPSKENIAQHLKISFRCSKN